MFYRRLVVREFATWEVLCDLGLEMPSASATPIVPFLFVSHVVSFWLCLHTACGGLSSRTLLLGNLGLPEPNVWCRTQWFHDISRDCSLHMFFSSPRAVFNTCLRGRH